NLLSLSEVNSLPDCSMCPTMLHVPPEAVRHDEAFFKFSDRHVNRVALFPNRAAAIAVNDLDTRYNRRIMAQTPWGDLPVNDAHVHFFSREFYRGLARQKKLTD